jgi:hypothetical protein
MASEGQKIMEVSATKFFFIMLTALVISGFVAAGIDQFLRNRVTQG